MEWDFGIWFPLLKWKASADWWLVWGYTIIHHELGIISIIHQPGMTQNTSYRILQWSPHATGRNPRNPTSSYFFPMNQSRYFSDFHGFFSPWFPSIWRDFPSDFVASSRLPCGTCLCQSWTLSPWRPGIHELISYDVKDVITYMYIIFIQNRMWCYDICVYNSIYIYIIT